MARLASRLIEWTLMTTLIFSIWIGIIQRTAPRQPYLCTVAGVACPKYVVRGLVANGWELPAQVFRQNFETYREQHAQLTVYYGEDVVIDLYGVQEGHIHKRAGLLTGEAASSEYDHNSMQLVFSSSKGITSLVIAMAVDRGYFKYTDRVSQYWPEFGSDDKADITIEDLMKHEGRLPYLSRKVAFTELADMDAFADVLAQSPTVLPPGERGYHAVTRGFYLNELIRRTDPKRRTIGQFIKDEIAKPLGIDQTMILGLANEDASVRQRLFETSQDGTPSAVVKVLLPIAIGRINKYLQHIPVLGSITNSLADMFPVNPLLGELLSRVLDKNSTMYRSTHVLSEVDGTPVYPNTFAGLTYEAPSSNLVANARSLAACAAVLANGGELNGVRLLNQSTIDEGLSHFTNKYDHVLGMNTTFGRGGWGRDYGRVFSGLGSDWNGWSGWGGSRFKFSPSRKLAIGYAQTRMGSGLGGLNDDRTDPLFVAISQTYDDIKAWEKQKQKQQQQQY